MRRLLARLGARRLVDSGPDRRATWLELFFDLVFAAAVAEVAGLLGERFDWHGLAGFLVPFLLIWWAWVGHTFFATRYDSDDTGQRLLTLGQMFLVAVMAANAHPEMMGREGGGLVAAYGGIRILLALQYARTVAVDPTGTVAGRHALVAGSTGAAWLVVALLPGTARLLAGAAVLAVELASARWASAGGRQPVHEAHLPERFGLFTLIVLGEVVAGTMAGMRHQETWTPPAAGAALLGLGMAFTVWWGYFEVLRVPLPFPEASSGTRSAGWLATHLPLCLGVVVAGTGIERIVETGAADPLSPAGAALLAAALVAVLAALLLLAAPRSHAGISRGNAALAVAAAAAGIFANRYGAVWLLAALLTGLAAVVLLPGRRRPAALTL